MLRFFNLRRRRDLGPSFTFSRPLVALHSDDWGRVGVRDRDGFELLRSRGVRLGERPYDLYSLETAEDVAAVADLLGRHHDSTGRPPCLTLYACATNLDFKRMHAEGYRRTIQLPLSRGLPGYWSRPGLFDAYRAGIERGVFQPALHGTVHFNEEAVAKALARNGDRAELLRTMWIAETPYIFWRMPWIGYEYSGPEDGFATISRQRQLVKQACEAFAELFGMSPVSACAPGYRANADTCQAWGEQGIHVAASGTGDGLKAPYMDETGVLHVYRNVDFEPSQQELDVEKYVELAGVCFGRGIPLIVSIHSINFHSTIRDFRSPSIAALDKLLSALESRYPDLLYVKDADLYQLVNQGALADGSSKVNVAASQRGWKASIVPMEAV